MPVTTDRGGSAGRRSADEDEFHSFAAEFGPALVRAAYLLLRDRDAADDAVQLTLLRTFRRWRHARSAPEAYSRLVLINVCRDHWRHQRRHPVAAPVTEDSLIHEGVSPAEEIDGRLALSDALARLPAQQREVLVLRFFLDLSVRRRRARLSVVSGGAIAALAVAAVLTVDGSGTPAQTQLGQSRLRLASYSFRLPRRAHAVSATPAACAIGGAVTYEAAPGEFPSNSPSSPQQSTIAQAVTDSGGCVSMLLTAPYTPGSANAPHEAFPVVDQHPVQVGSYTGTVGTAEVIGSGSNGSSDPTINGVSVPSGTTHQFLTVHLPTSGGQVQDLQVAVAGISEQQLVAIVSSGLTQS